MEQFVAQKVNNINHLLLRVCIFKSSYNIYIRKRGKWGRGLHIKTV
jgi:hypothetical protein